ncbi:MAG: D-alanine--D-alanine ligase [Gammaproteobacteria bacterium]|nr:D-alanine--D-alanine ligase [Gammaproteobacteria bacterium]
MPVSHVNNPEDFGRVAVVMGGWSAEREISLKSGEAVIAAMLEKKIDAFSVDMGGDILSVIENINADRVFNIVHGRGGEDGQLQSLLETKKLPYTGAGILGSALAMDKLRCKLIWQGAGLATPKFQVLDDARSLQKAADEIGFPLIIKPVLEGSSVGMAKVNSVAELQSAWQQAKQYGEVIAEEWVIGKEYTAAYLAGDMLPLIRLETDHEFYDYDAKYVSNDTQYFCPCGLTSDVEKQYQSLCLDALNVVAIKGWCRVDFMVDKNDKLWLIEVNTVPGMTDHSLVPMAAKKANMDFPELVWRILETTMDQGVGS